MALSLKKDVPVHVFHSALQSVSPHARGGPSVSRTSDETLSASSRCMGTEARDFPVNGRQIQFQKEGFVKGNTKF